MTMHRFAILAAALALITTLTACAGTSSRVQSNERFSGMTFSMPVGTAF